MGIPSDIFVGKDKTTMRLTEQEREQMAKLLHRLNHPPIFNTKYYETNNSDELRYLLDKALKSDANNTKFKKCMTNKQKIDNAFERFVNKYQESFINLVTISILREEMENILIHKIDKEDIENCEFTKNIFKKAKQAFDDGKVMLVGNVSYLYCEENIKNVMPKEAYMEKE